ncbi:glycosyl transferase family 2, partial [Candidatus Woesearchaeota archaeon]
MEYDIVAGIPSYNNQNTIGFVAQQIDKSLTNHFSKFKSIIVNCDGRSHDNTTKVFLETDTKTEKKVLLAKPGTTGKGTVFKQLFEFAQRVKARAIVVNDSDLRSINPEWVRSQLTAILGQGYDFAAPYYIRHKYDASITNHICYPIVYALLGCDIRQPIGGDFAFSSRLCNHWLKQDWNKEAYLFGIDIFMTTTAILGGFKLCQVKLGAKIHDAKDPSQSLAPMFKQVVATLFRVINLNLEELSKVKGVANPPILGNLNPSEPEPIQVDLESAQRRFVEGF